MFYKVLKALDSTRLSPSAPMGHAPHELLIDCREKLNRLQHEMLEDERRRKAVMKESQALEEDLAELREVKTRSMSQLQSFLELRARQREGKLKNAMSQLLPLEPLDLSSAWEDQRGSKIIKVSSLCEASWKGQHRQMREKQGLGEPHEIGVLKSAER